jgi:3',5'-cyclic AMP phosphodiesterase CpdA
MSTRRLFIKTGLTTVAAVSLLPAVNTFAAANNQYERTGAKKLKLRFALASDAHYGQPDTNDKADFENMIRWLNEDYAKNHLDMVIINGDLVHDQPNLLPVVKSTYLDKLKASYYTLPGNHDHADAALWQKVFGYEDNYVVDKGDVAFVLANTADTAGKYICPNVAFLKKSLDGFAGKKTVFVILHIPPVKWTATDPFVDCPEVMQLIGQYPNVKALFHGHDHLLDGVRYSGKLPHFFDSHIGGNWGTEYRGYRIVEVDENDNVYTYQVNASKNPVLNANKL